MPSSDHDKDCSQAPNEKPHPLEAEAASEPSYEYTLEPPPIEPRDASLGRYMDAWSRLETAIHYAAQEILEIEADAAYAIWSAIQTFQAIKVLEAAAKLRLKPDGQKRVSKICEKLVRRNIRRNYIIHGTWMQSIRLNFIGSGQTHGPWRRVYSHVDPDMPKSDDGSDLTILELDKPTDHVEEMVGALWSLVDDIPQLRVQRQIL